MNEPEPGPVERLMRAVVKHVSLDLPGKSSQELYAALTCEEWMPDPIAAAKEIDAALSEKDHDGINVEHI